MSGRAAGNGRRRWRSLEIAEVLAAEYGGDGPAGSALPSERTLAERFGVQRPTVRVALEYLAHQGLIERRERVGWFVNPPRFEYDPLGPGIPKERLSIEVVTTDPTGQPLPPRPGLVFVALRKYAFDGRLVVAAHSYLRPDLRRALTDGEIAAPLRDSFAAAGRRSGVELTHNQVTIVAATVGPELAPVLGITARQPVLDVTRVHHSHDEVVGVDLEHWRSDVVAISFTDRRHPVRPGPARAPRASSGPAPGGGGAVDSVPSRA